LIEISPLDGKGPTEYVGTADYMTRIMGIVPSGLPADAHTPATTIATEPAAREAAIAESDRKVRLAELNLARLTHVNALAAIDRELAELNGIQPAATATTPAALSAVNASVKVAPPAKVETAKAEPATKADRKNGDYSAARMTDAANHPHAVAVGLALTAALRAEGWTGNGNTIWSPDRTMKVEHNPSWAFLRLEYTEKSGKRFADDTRYARTQNNPMEDLTYLTTMFGGNGDWSAFRPASGMGFTQHAIAKSAATLAPAAQPTVPAAKGLQTTKAVKTPVTTAATATSTAAASTAPTATAPTAAAIDPATVAAIVAQVMAAMQQQAA
jgi:hypothetical protein